MDLRSEPATGSLAADTKRRALVPPA